MRAVYNFDHGPEFEVAVVEVLRGALPDRAGVCRGFVVDADGREIGDDIIVYDRARFPTLRALGGDLSKKERVPAEAVLGYFETKHTLRLDGTEDDSSSALRAIRQAAQVRTLRRAAVPINQVGGINLAGQGLKVTRPPGWPQTMNPWYTGVIARSATAKDENLEQALRKALDSASQTAPLPDLVVAGPLLCLPLYLLPEPERAGQAEHRPFLVEGLTPVVIPVGPHAFGMAVVQMLWAFEMIQLGPLPWQAMLTSALLKNWPKAEP